MVAQHEQEGLAVDPFFRAEDGMTESLLDLLCNYRNLPSKIQQVLAVGLVFLGESIVVFDWRRGIEEILEKLAIPALNDEANLFHASMYGFFNQCHDGWLCPSLAVDDREQFLDDAL